VQKHILLVSVIVVLFLADPWACESAFAGYLYGMDQDSSLFQIDPTDGSYDLVSENSALNIGGLAYNSNDGYLYGMSQSGLLILYQIDATDGSYHIVPDVVPLGRIGGLAYNPDDGQLYGWGAIGHGLDALYRINPTDGILDLVDYGVSVSILTGLAYNNNDAYLYGWGHRTGESNSLYRNNLTIGALSLVAPGGDVGAITGLAYNSTNGYLYGMRADGRLYQIDPVDGSYNIVAETGVLNIHGLAYVPEPSTFLLLSLGTALLRRRR